MSVTIYDVAREANVSMATVSRVINGTAVVKEETKKRVQDAIERLGYRPNAVARGLASKRTRTIGVIVPDVSTAFVAEIVRGIEDIANMYNYHIILTNSDADTHREVSLIGTMWEKQVDGILYMTNILNQEHITAFEQAEIPVVLCATEDPEKRIPSVNIDNRKAGSDAANYLEKKSCQNIAIVSPDIGTSLIADHRIEGVRKKLGNKCTFIHVGKGKYEQALPILRNIFQNKNYDGVIAMSDELGLASVHAIHDNGFQVPHDVRIIAFDNTRLATMVRPELTVIAQPMYDFGAVSMRLLTKMLLDEPVDTYNVILQHNIIERQSS
ncbi:substrate-binding domain-containing protein [Alicyclobacillus tolerans]|uniref:substrate-binding domain-containing protein n=1 Tax=Alicyclobacillus tolerans TaxID=90970 RepID=UPI003B7680DE